MFDFIITGLLFIAKLLCYIKFLTARLLTNIALRASSGHEPNPKIDVHFAFLTYIVVTCVAGFTFI